MGVFAVYISRFGWSQAKFSDKSHTNTFNTASTYVSKGIVTGARMTSALLTKQDIRSQISI
ncbi:hypothetical protein PILCRDRAFT_810992 [Piloderma croceum F 1598]|uniref:Uncharacterized protein n=1 Tax=Piloderma croceum (strain F 1598) TaxID=765440 RepID=A0A0C3CPU7_PILCF|nr:hypothetical protein PILCRDRAFT_810992 [Piloderma croceum F 1598]